MNILFPHLPRVISVHAIDLNWNILCAYHKRLYSSILLHWCAHPMRHFHILAQVLLVIEPGTSWLWQSSKHFKCLGITIFCLALLQKYWKCAPNISSLHFNTLHYIIQVRTLVIDISNVIIKFNNNLPTGCYINHNICLFFLMYNHLVIAKQLNRTDLPERW